MAENKISLSIAGLKLLITTPEEEEDVRKMAEELEENIKEVMAKATSASVTEAMMLCALEYLDNFKKTNRAANNLRTQIKEYMAEAANAKREYDDEHKRVEEMAAEISALRSHLTRLATEGDTSGVLLKLRDEVNTANAELVRQRKRCGELTVQNKALSEKGEAMNTFIAGQDREIARLSAVADELNIRLLDQTRMAGEWSERISWFESQIAELSDEKKRLQTELERMIAESSVSGLQPEIETPPEDGEGLNTDFDDEEDVTAEEPDFAQAVAQAEEPDSADAIAQAEEPDFADAIAQVGVRKPIERRPIQDYDIDISDLPLRPASLPEEVEQQDVFAGYKIEEDADTLGFESLRNSIAQDEVKEEQISFEWPPSLAERDAGQPETPETVESYRPEHLNAVLENISFEPAAVKQPQQEVSNVPEAPAEKKNSFLTDIIETETRRLGKQRKGEQTEEDAMPNLNWTLDI